MRCKCFPKSNCTLFYLVIKFPILDNVFFQEFPVADQTLRDVLLAIIGALSIDAGALRAGHFVLDFIFTGLLDRNVNEVFIIKNPMSLLADILQREGRAEPEPRIIGKTGEADITGAFQVGIYSNKVLIGQGMHYKYFRNLIGSDVITV